MRSISRTLLATSLLLAACGDDGSGNNGGGGGDQAYLTIIGEDDLVGDPGTTTQLVVRYHDANNQPIVGEVTFGFAGDPLGSTLSRTSVVTGIDGRATVDLRYADQGDAAFQVVASADEANDAKWRVAVLPAILELLGKYRVDSTFVLPDGLPEGEADGLMTFVDMTNDPNDPATYFLDRVQASLDEPMDDILAYARAGFGLDAMLNEMILESSPDFVTDLRLVGDRLDEVIKTLRPVTELNVLSDGSDDAAMGGTHRVTGSVFVVNGVTYEYTADQMQLGTMSDVQVSMSRPSERKVAIARHTMHLPYGRLIQHALDHAVIPSVDPAAANVTQFLANAIDCEAIGARLATEVGVGTPAMFEAGCIAAVDAAVGELTGDIRAIEADLDIEGTADLIDGDVNHVVEKLMGGLWEGQLVFASGAVALPRPNQTFTGTRLFAPTN
jgi:hypothetical protein